MTARRFLVDCVVLSVQDACVFYPCCKGCFSRIDADQQDTARCRCSRCGYSCARELVDYRYRLSLRVSRDMCIFGVTVFGTCLNPFFGIHASDLQRLVENSDGPVGRSARSVLLQKAVKECFTGRHFIFGIKVTETEGGPWLGANGFDSKDPVHFIASQMILPKATGLEGCTVVSYYQTLLQKAAEYEIALMDPSKTPKLPATTLLLIRRHSPAGSFNNDTLCSSGLLSQSRLRSHYQDSTLTPTPPWQQSLGLVTSSAEQEEDCSTQNSGDENSRQTDNSKTPPHARRDCPEDHKATALSPLLPLECSSYNRTSFANYPHLFIEKAGGESSSVNTPILKTWLCPSPLGHNSCEAKGFSSRRLTETFSRSSVAWEDLPFSESLSEFLQEENKDVDIISKTEPRQNVPRQNEATRNDLEIKSQDKNSPFHITDCHSHVLLDISNTPAVNGGDRHDLSERVCKSTAGSMNKSPARNICSHDHKQEGETDSSLFFENEEEQLEGDAYNCSADLFSGSIMSDVGTNELSTCAEAVRMTTESFPVLCKPDKWHPRSERTNVSHSTPNKRSLIPAGVQELDFIPPSQSTPIVKAAVLSESPASFYRTLTLDEFSQDSFAFYRNLPELDGKRPVPSSRKLNCVRANQLCQHARDSTKENQVQSVTSSRHSHRFTPKRRFWKPGKNKNHVLAQQHARVMKGALNTGSTGRLKYDSSHRDATACDYEGSDEVPPTPAKTRQSVKLRRRTPTDDGHLGLTPGQQGAGVNDKRSPPDQTLTPSHQCDSETVNLDACDRYRLDNENEACDWSRDLFSDSL